jgi:hypothetical protein
MSSRSSFAYAKAPGLSAAEDDDEGLDLDLSPQLNPVLRSEVVRNVTLGIRTAVTHHAALVHAKRRTRSHAHSSNGSGGLGGGLGPTLGGGREKSALRTDYSSFPCGSSGAAGCEKAEAVPTTPQRGASPSAPAAAFFPPSGADGDGAAALADAQGHSLNHSPATGSSAASAPFGSARGAPLSPLSGAGLRRGPPPLHAVITTQSSLTTDAAQAVSFVDFVLPASGTRFRDYHPAAFRSLRKLAGLGDDEYCSQVGAYSKRAHVDKQLNNRTRFFFSFCYPSPR